ncbi:glycosyl transferase family 2 [Mariniflexile fucanivorans]|uniref:Glycosyl transferase family 2 n=1 Tax=Mariniflexile fucanivorans TaxID=264023 RepID=A0A4R1RDD9_9FLAO|nr:glycosyltransferase family A protein [Mariniflexile fucanivorans]TCL63884.1 glycosyl transferase family 2 [Mariniflexile fucanivorans]
MMRKGENISKENLLNLTQCSHRVIIPLHIPHQNDYYKDAFQIFEMCLKSVLKTAQSPLKISIISDACCDKVNKQLLNLKEQNYIDELIFETENIGKINSILKALRNTQERLVTITDADVIFINNWEQEVLKVFESFPNAGVVCPVPVFRTHFRLTSNIWLRYLFSKKLYFLPVKNEVALTKFANSIGWPWLDTKWKDTIGAIKAKNGTIAVLGSSHFVATYKIEVFKKLPKDDSVYKLGGDSEHLYTDLPVLKVDGFRLATYDNFAYHLGNTLENWAIDAFENLEEEPKVFNNFQSLKKLKSQPFNYWLSEKIFKKIFYFIPFKKFILKTKGLNNEQIKHFVE